MTNNNIDSDKAAAELMELRTVNNVNGINFPCELADDDSEPFTLSNKADRMDFVEWMGEKHGVSVAFRSPYGWSALLVSRAEQSVIKECMDSHEEATRAAANYLMEGK